MRKFTTILGILIILYTGAALAELVSFPAQNLVLDTTNELMWLDYPVMRQNWTNQTAAAAASTLSGFTDWRLPTATELLTVSDSTKVPKIDEAFSLGAVGNWSLWTSSIPDATLTRRYIDKSRAYIIWFDDLHKTHEPKKTSHSAIFVRDGSGEFLLDADGRYLFDNSGNFLVGGD